MKVALFIIFMITANQSLSQSAYELLLKTIYEESVPLINASELREQQNEVIIVDTRSKAEYEVSHISGAVFYDYDNGTISDLLPLLDQNKAIILYCSIGYRSERIGEQLLEQGFAQVFNLKGGIFNWMNEEWPVVDMDDLPTQKIHAYNRIWGVWVQKGEKVYE